MTDRLKERLTVQKNTVSADEYGNHINSWVDYFSCKCRINTYPKDEKDGTVVYDDRIATFEVRYCSELMHIDAVNYRIVFRDDVYDILAVDMMNWNKKAIHIRCEKEKRNG
jgi:SPP1 family predicted phage head-tail adaptor